MMLLMLRTMVRTLCLCGQPGVLHMHLSIVIPQLVLCFYQVILQACLLFGHMWTCTYLNTSSSYASSAYVMFTIAASFRSALPSQSATHLFLHFNLLLHCRCGFLHISGWRWNSAPPDLPLCRGYPLASSHQLQYGYARVSDTL